jgi:CHAT domain-containing protein
VSYLVPSLTLLARARLMLGDVPGARELFNRATRAVESDDDYLVTEKSRLSFDNERRELYESVIAFEYAHNDFDAAWGYLQQYRSKLFLEFLGQVNPAVAKVRHDTFRSDSVQKLIPSDAQVVEYFMLKDQLIIWVASRDRLLPTMVPIDREALERRIGDLVSSIRRRDDVNASLADLYELLIAPVERHLDSSKALAIIPDQALHRLPFAALKQASSDKYLIEKYTILESPNLTTLLASAAAPERNVVRSYGSPDGAAPVGAEVLSFGGLYPDVRTFGGAVSKDRFLADLRIAAIFHYGGHTVDAPDPLNSAILLDGDRVGPNSLTAAEISRQRLRPNAVVVLASCDSSVGNFRDGVSLRGLTSAFLIAGAGTVAGSLWPVEEVSASSLMRSFHEAFARNVSGAESMRQAQTSLMTRNPRLAHPYYWSGFVVNGNLSAVR